MTCLSSVFMGCVLRSHGAEHIGKPRHVPENVQEQFDGWVLKLRRHSGRAPCRGAPKPILGRLRKLVLQCLYNLLQVSVSGDLLRHQRITRGGVVDFGFSSKEALEVPEMQTDAHRPERILVVA